MQKKPQNLKDIFNTFYYICNFKVIPMGIIGAALFIIVNTLFYKSLPALPYPIFFCTLFGFIDLFLITFFQAAVTRSIEDHLNNQPIKAQSLFLDHGGEIFSYNFIILICLIILSALF